MNRREFIKSLVVGYFVSAGQRRREYFARTPTSVINTVQGPRSLDALGITLMHEHVLVDFIGADKISRDRYDGDAAFRRALPFMKKIYALGCRTLVDCTPAYLGRDLVLLKRLSKASRLNVLTNTGYYGAANHKFVPAHAYRETAEQLARRWTQEYFEGIEGTGIKPGIIKIGVDKGFLSEIHVKLVQAAARTHLDTGLTIASHTGDGAAALQQLALLKKEGVSAGAFIWVHAQNETRMATHFEAAQQGAWVEFDGIGEKSIDRHVTLVKQMIERGFIGRTLISQDAGWYHVGEPGGGDFRSYETLFTEFIPALKKSGVSSEQIRTLLRDNPKHVLEPKVTR